LADIVADNKRNITPSRVELDQIKINLNEEDSMKVRLVRILKRDVLSDIITVEGTFPNLPPKSKRFRKSTGMTNLKLASKKAKELAKAEYKYRLSYGTPSKSLNNHKLITAFVQYITKQTEKKMPMNRGIWNADNLKKHSGNALNLILPNLPSKPFSLLNGLDIRNLVAELKKEKSDKTIANVKTTFNYIWEYAENIGVVDGNPPKFPTLQTKRHSDDDGFGHATPKEVLLAFDSIDNELKRNTLTDYQRHKLFVFRRWWVLLVDCGFRPYYQPEQDNRLPLVVDRVIKDSIFFKRFEKRISYIAQGGHASIKAVEELETYYKEQGIKNKELIVHLDGEPFTKKAWETLVRYVMDVIEWKGKTDKHGRPLVSYSIRHQHITTALENEEDVIQIAKRCGTSVAEIMRVYYEHDFYRKKKSDSIL
jgi:hypothetical protein